MNDTYSYYGDAVLHARGLLAEDSYAAALSHLRAAAKIEPSLDKEAENLEAKFFYMLRFITSNNDVADLDSSLDEIRREFETLLHRIELELETKTKSTLRSGLLRYAALRPEESIETLVSDYIAALDALNKDSQALTDSRRRSGVERIATDIFNRLWCQYPLQGDTAALLSSIILDTSLPEYDRLLWVNALGLALNDYSSDEVAGLLLDIHAAGATALSVTAAVWLVLSLTRRLDTEHEFALRSRVFATIAANQASDMGDIFVEWARTMGTEDVSERFRSDISGHLREIGEAMKSRMKDIDPEKIEESMMNADWMTADIGSDGFDAIKRFMEAQQKGEDVFMGTLGKMRSFDFFNIMANWFLPFHAGHSSLASVVDGEGAALCDLLEKMPMMCDSDKYAIVLSMAQMPEPMRSSSLGAMSQQIMSVYSSDEFQEAMTSEDGKERRLLINNVFKNIYRFFRLFKQRDEFRDSLSFGFDVRHELYINNDARLADIADILFMAKHYEVAAEAYSHLADADFDFSISQLQKWGMAEELANGNYAALQIYRTILEEEPGDLWTAMRAAQCMSVEREYDEAVAILAPLAETNGDNVELLRLLADAYSNADRWSDAVNVYHNLDYLMPDGDNSVKGDLAWALTLTGDYELAEEMFAQAPVDTDAMRHHAFLKWIKGQRSEAVKLYEAAMVHWNNSDEAVTPDPGYDYLLKNVPEAKSVPLIHDVVRYRRYGSQFGNILN